MHGAEYFIGNKQITNLIALRAELSISIVQTRDGKVSEPGNAVPRNILGLNFRRRFSRRIIEQN